MWNIPIVVSIRDISDKDKLPKNKWYISEFDYLLQSDGDYWSKTYVPSSKDIQF